MSEPSDQEGVEEHSHSRRGEDEHGILRTHPENPGSESRRQHGHDHEQRHDQGQLQDGEGYRGIGGDEPPTLSHLVPPRTESGHADSAGLCQTGRRSLGGVLGQKSDQDRSNEVHGSDQGEGASDA